MRPSITTSRAAISIALLISQPVFAESTVGLTAGSGRDADMTAVTISLPWERKWFTDGDWHWGGYWQAEVSYWKGKGERPENGVFGLGFAPVFRFEPKSRSAITPYLEGAIGLHLFNETQLHAQKKIGTAFEFGDHLGFGITFGDRGRYDLGYRYQHFSNAGISKNNGGVNFHQLVLKVGM
jgi:hypothetical protein